MTAPRDHGGGLDAAARHYGGIRDAWLDLSTGINPVPYPTNGPCLNDWTALPDTAAMTGLLDAARRFWGVPDTAQIVAAPGASALIARLPAIAPLGPVHIPGPTYNEHAAAFRAHGRQVIDSDATASVHVHVHVHPNNPDGHLWHGSTITGATLTILDESFCDTSPDLSYVAQTATPGTVVLKSFGKFWGLAGLRLGFAIGHPDTLAPQGRAALTDLLGPWPVAGPALIIGTRALSDDDWAAATRDRLTKDAARLDALLEAAGAHTVGGTSLFRLYEVDNAATWQDRLAKGQVWSRIFPYSDRWLRLGLPAPDRWNHLTEALR